MIKLIIGIAFIVFVLPLLLLVESEIFVVIILGIFLLVGLLLVISGLKNIIRDMKTKQYGVTCYGIVLYTEPSGTVVNGKVEYKASFQIINPQTFQPETVEEVLGSDASIYPEGSFVLCKYYEGDINLEGTISENDVPGDIKKRLVVTEQSDVNKTSYN